ncbi:MAG: ATP-binding cassette domain-containing protein [Pseudomonadota bacterium]
MAPPLLNLQNIRLTFGTTPLLTGAELMVHASDRICLVGRNGSGKSTLLKIAAGLIEPDEGEVFVKPGATVRYLEQEPDLSGFDTVRAYVETGLAPGDDPYRAVMLLEALGLTGEETTDRLSGGEARRAALARAIAPEPDILMMDEPTNHLDLPAIEWLEAELKSRAGALVLISHDRRFLENLSRATVWLDRGEARRLEKGFAHFEDWRDQVLEAEALEQHKLDRQIAREEHWVRYGVTARRKRNVRRMAELAALRQKRRDHRGPQGAARIEASEATGTGQRVFEAREIAKRYGERDIVKPFSTRVMKGDRIAIIGPNGAGKTTLLNMLTGALKPDAGEVRLGVNLQLAALDQKRAQLKPNWTVTEALAQGSDYVELNGSRRHVMAYMKDFLFAPEQARTPVHALSGGERARLLLARVLALPSNVLVLDEPTNDLDLETLDLLEELIEDYAGTVILVSHDRDFIDRTAASVIAFEGDGLWREYAGGYSDMVAQRGEGVKARETEVRSKKPASGDPAPAKSRPSARKMSFKDKHALEALPGEIEALDAEIAASGEALADPQLFTRDPERFNALSQAHAKALEEKAAKEERWLELEMLREEIEAERAVR